MIIALACVIAIAVIAFILGVRAKDLPEPEPESPFLHLDERKAAIYENLRDLQFEYRVGKLSDQDYQNTKKDLQRELALVLAEVDALKAQLALGKVGQVGQAGQVGQVVPPATHSLSVYSCSSCGAHFEKPLKFCGECGKPMTVAQT
jgi:NADH pyrophosphatase NudC (nudix superfamily)